MTNFTVHLVDGTYELFRHYFAVPSKIHLKQEVGAVRSTLRSLTNLLLYPPISAINDIDDIDNTDKGPATHIGVATDQMIESFRNRLYEGYKDGGETPEDLKSQFPLLEEGIELAGFKLWASGEYEADDSLGTIAQKCYKSEKVKRVIIHTVDKDLTQCITPDNKVVQYDRRREILYRYNDVIEKFGVKPESIPDYLALVGDTSDGIPGLPGFGSKSVAAILKRYEFIENIPKEPGLWDITLRGADKLAKTFNTHHEDAILFKKLTTLVRNIPNLGTLNDMEWSGTKPGFEEFCKKIAAPDICEKIKNSNLNN